MILKSHIKLLNEWGGLSSSLIMRRFKIGRDEARILLKQILYEYRNVKATSDDNIFIEEPPITKESKQRKKRASIWKDVTKP